MRLIPDSWASSADFERTVCGYYESRERENWNNGKAVFVVHLQKITFQFSYFFISQNEIFVKIC